VLHDDAHGQIRRINLDGSGAEVYAVGVRNTVGFDWHPETRQLYFTDNGRDWLSETVPEDELNRVTSAGEHLARRSASRATCSTRISAGARTAATTPRRSA
jgi:glucose/arabinose dehydrogenase